MDNNKNQTTEGYLQIAPSEPSPVISTPDPSTMPEQPAKPIQPPADPIIIVLQWLTYAFWGWTVFSMSILTALVFANFLSGANDADFIPYAIAAVLVLLPISIASDVFYSKQEPRKKVGATSIIMVTHAVLFAIFGIGAVIAIVFSLVQMFISSSDSTNTRTALFTSIIMAALYAAIFLRTLNPPRFSKFRKQFLVFMVLAVGIITILGIVGPISHAHATKDDRLIEDNLYGVQTGVDDYVTAHHQLPDKLSSLELSGDTKNLVKSSLIRYKANTKPAAVTEDTINNSVHKTDGTPQYNLPKTFYYNLCVTYRNTGGRGYNSSYSGGTIDSDGYDSFVSTTDHPAGIFCYKVDSTPIY